jgi:hypothetical protein
MVIGGHSTVLQDLIDKLLQIELALPIQLLGTALTVSSTTDPSSTRSLAETLTVCLALSPVFSPIQRSPAGFFKHGTR